MLVTTTASVDGKQVKQYLGVVSAEVILGANVFRDMFAAFRDFFGGRSRAYEKVLIRAKELALEKLETTAADRGANAVIGVQIDHEVVGAHGGMIMVSMTGTAVLL